MTVLSGDAAAQELPRPEAVPAALPSRVGTAAPFDVLPSPSYARAVAERAVAAIDELTRRIAENVARIESLTHKRSQCGARAARLRSEKEAMIRDMRQGFFCSKCRVAKSEFERRGENFYAHIREVGAVAVAASQSEIDDKALTYDRMLAEAVREYQACYQGTTAEIDRLQQEAQAAYAQLQEGINLWKTATTFEDNLLTAQEEAARTRAAQRDAEISDQLGRITAARATLRAKGELDAATALILDNEQATWERLKAAASARAQERTHAYAAALAGANETRIREYAALGGHLGRASPYRDYVLQLSTFLPTISLSYEPVSVYLSPDQLGVRFQFGKYMSGSLEAQTTPASSEVRTFVTLFGQVKAGVGWRTQYSPEGVTSGPTMKLDLTPPDGPAPKAAKPSADPSKPDLPKP